VSLIAISSAVNFGMTGRKRSKIGDTVLQHLLYKSFFLVPEQSKAISYGPVKPVGKISLSGIGQSGKFVPHDNASHGSRRKYSVTKYMS
jgi:hypothetical protein